MLIDKIISGGQTGVDRAALDIAIKHNIAHGGWCPRGRIAEDGTIDERYNLTETDSREYACRTKWNVRDSDGSLILNSGRLAGGTAVTVSVSRRCNKPCHCISLDKTTDVSDAIEWISRHNIRILNIAGPRESKQPGIYKE
ncbi:MAG: putative molybdenum carrier protein, partial [Gammaproteobacteria bacterium]|nr:putative molybdenum carrier protein [Gammaproteobacteria bacterium]